MMKTQQWLLASSLAVMMVLTAPVAVAQQQDVDAPVAAQADAAETALPETDADEIAPDAEDSAPDALLEHDAEADDVAAVPHSLPTDLSPWGMYLAADAVVKTVMIGLLLASVLTWTVWVFKTVQLRVGRRRVRHTLEHVVASESFAEARRATQNDQGAAVFLLQAAEHELALSARGPATEDGIKERVAARLDRVLAAATSDMNKGTSVLATIGAVAPFVGLFGTVWGIMNSFIGIAKTQTTNLAVVAPGIAEALLATAIGLVAAIPAVVIYNHFARTIGYYRASLADVATGILALVSRDLDRTSPAARQPGKGEA
ncbi:tonB-system energizer ExbB [Isoalcanivorax beigongshangi]|uniref:Biopolymer transport protein ExbB n=1 Tax=Isoalcanivorax beigongshangi TaxID=3238810 RepID=A0ABV4AI88_9GAMM